jgi:hypothetical protein
VDSPPNGYVPKPRFEYRRPSVFAEHKFLAIAFILVLIGVTVYLIRAPHRPLIITPPPAPPVYIEPIGPKSG